MDTVVEMAPVQGGSWRETRYSLIPRSRANSKEKGVPDAGTFFAGGGEDGMLDDSVHAGSEFSYLDGEWEEGEGEKHPIWGDPTPRPNA